MLQRPLSKLADSRLWQPHNVTAWHHLFIPQRAGRASLSLLALLIVQAKPRAEWPHPWQLGPCNSKEREHFNHLWLVPGASQQVASHFSTTTLRVWASSFVAHGVQYSLIDSLALAVNGMEWCHRDCFLVPTLELVYNYIVIKLICLDYCKSVKVVRQDQAYKKSNCTAVVIN